MTTQEREHYEKQRIEIARFCDFYVMQDDDSPTFALRHGRDTTLYSWHDCETEAWMDAPDYPSDFQAMHEALMQLSRFQFEHCIKVVKEIVRSSNHVKFFDWSDEMLVAYAGANHWAEAFLKTIGKWKD